MENFFQPIRAALWQEPFTPGPVSDEWVQMHLQQGTATLVFPLVPMTQEMKSVCVRNIQEQVKLQYTLVKAWKALEAAGIEAVLMKGAGIAALYPEMSMRHWSDIDLFVGKEQYHPACAVLRETFPDALKFDEELDHYKHYNLIPDGVSIEVHRVTVALTHPRDIRRYAKMEEYGRTNAERLKVNGLEVKVFEPTFNTLLIFLHSWEHMTTEGACVRQLCDLAMLINHYNEKINWPLLELWLKQLNLLEIWYLYANILVQSLGLTINTLVNDSEMTRKRAERLLEAMIEGPLRCKTADAAGPASSVGNKNRFVRKWRTMKERMEKAERLVAFSPSYARHIKWAIWLSGLKRLFAPDRHWE